MKKIIIHTVFGTFSFYPHDQEWHNRKELQEKIVLIYGYNSIEFDTIRNIRMKLGDI